MVCYWPVDYFTEQSGMQPYDFIFHSWFSPPPPLFCRTQYDLCELWKQHLLSPILFTNRFTSYSPILLLWSRGSFLTQSFSNHRLPDHIIIVMCGTIDFLIPLRRRKSYIYVWPATLPHPSFLHWSLPLLYNGYFLQFYYPSAPIWYFIFHHFPPI